MSLNQIFLFALCESSVFNSSLAQLQMNQNDAPSHSAQMNRIFQAAAQRRDPNAHTFDEHYLSVEPQTLQRRHGGFAMHDEAPHQDIDTVYDKGMHDESIAAQLEQDELDEEMDKAIQQLGQRLDELFNSQEKEQILRMIIYQTTGSQEPSPQLSQLTIKGGCVAIVLCDYFVLARQRNVLPFLNVRHSMIHLAYAASAKQNFDLEKSVAQFNDLMTTVKTDNGHFYGLEEFYRPTHGLGKSDMFEYFQVLIKIYLGVDALEAVMTKMPNLIILLIDLILGGMTTVKGMVQKGLGFNDIAFDFINFLYMGGRQNNMLLQPAFGLLFVGVAILKVIFDGSKKKDFKKIFSDDEIKDLLYKTIYENRASQQSFSIASEFATDGSLWSITAHVHEQNRTNGTNVYALHAYITGMFRSERLAALDALFSNDGYSAIQLCRKARAQGFAIDPRVKKSYNNKLDKLVEDVQQLVISMAIAHGHVTKEYEPLLDVIAAAFKAQENTYRKSTRKLLDSSTMTKSWKSVISEKVLKCKKADGRYNKLVIAEALKQAHDAHTYAHESVASGRFFLDEETGYERIVEMLTMHQIESNYEEHSDLDYLAESNSQNIK